MPKRRGKKRQAIPLVSLSPGDIKMGYSLGQGRYSDGMPRVDFITRSGFVFKSMVGKVK